ncbi:MAG: ABC transporter ATP-binding protein [Alphaproteobacteria bacterium]|nr:ABC transporter ATP-binding protein [Alphaproteobacteria bacterium]
MSLLEIKNLSVYFKRRQSDDFAAVQNVSLSLEKGEILGIVGESGSGKSVTALSILGLLPYPKAYHDTKSSVKFKNKELIGLNDTEFQRIRGNQISFIFQEPMSSLNPLHKIGEQIAESLCLHQKSMSKEEVKAKTLELLQAVKIPRPEIKINAYPFELSGGQRQRVMIAMAIANNPEILIADEPTTALDVTIQEQIIDLLLDLKQKMNMAIIFISHNLRLVHKIADNIAVMYKGKLVEYGDAEQIFNSPQDDYTKKLISSNLSLNLRNKNKSKQILTGREIVVKFPVKKSFFGKITEELTAVDHINFDLSEGETLGVVGESGSGKTTLAMSVVNLIKYSGIFTYENKELSGFCKDIQIVFQDPYNSLNPRMKIYDIIREGLDIHYPNLTAEEQKESVLHILREVELDENVLSKYPHEFSGGQRQRIALARSLVIRPKILILDEPTSALDVTVQAQIIELLKALQNKFNLSYIFISHDMNAVRSISHRIMVMQNGKVVESGSTDDIFNKPQHSYTKHLIRASIV